MKEKIKDLDKKTMAELYKTAKELEIKGYTSFRKKELIYEIQKAILKTDDLLQAEGILDIMQDGYGFLRPVAYIPSHDDIYVSHSQIRKFDLRMGDRVQGLARPPKENERNFGLLRVELVNGEAPEKAAERLHFPGLTPIYPRQKIKMETTSDKVAARIIDLFAPIGKGQRGLIVSPPKAGKTELLKDIANSISTNHPEVEILILLIDERPEEVTDIERSVKAEVISSTFDSLPDNHINVSEIVLERAKRLVEHKKDVVILMDSLTRLARAYNLVTPPSGRTLSGGVDPTALYNPKRFFGAARNVEEGGSLTILATALVDTGSRMDDVIFEEFKGTGNMELILDRSLAEKRIFPAIDIKRSGTRKEELLLSEEELKIVWYCRKQLFPKNDNAETADMLIKSLQRTTTNADLIRAWPQMFK